MLRNLNPHTCIYVVGVMLSHIDLLDLFYWACCIIGRFIPCLHFRVCLEMHSTADGQSFSLCVSAAVPKQIIITNQERNFLSVCGLIQSRWLSVCITCEHVCLCVCWIVYWLVWLIQSSESKRGVKIRIPCFKSLYKRREFSFWPLCFSILMLPTDTNKVPKAEETKKWKVWLDAHLFICSLWISLVCVITWPPSICILLLILLFNVKSDTTTKLSDLQSEMSFKCCWCHVTAVAKLSWTHSKNISEEY